MESLKRHDIETARPVLAPGLRLHLSPVRSYLVAEEDLAQRAGESFPFPNPRGLLASLNPDAAELLLECTGRKQLREIVELLDRPERAFSMDEAKQFLEKAVELGHVTISKSQRVDIERGHTGSLDHFIPAHGSIEVTDHCNLACTYCYHTESASSERVLEFDELRHALVQWKELGLLAVELTGGEPLLSPHFWPLLEFCAGNFALTAVLTNGIEIAGGPLADLGAARNVVVFSVSLDASNATDFERVSGGSPEQFRKTLIGIEELAKTGVWFNVAMTACAETTDEILPTAKLAKRLGAGGFSCVPPQPFGSAVNMVWGPDEIVRYQQEMTRVAEEMPKFLSNLIERKGAPDLGKDGEECGLAKRSAVLSANGFIRGCPMMPASWSVGSVRQLPVREIFLGPAFQRLARFEFPSGGACEGCVYEPFCKGCLLRPNAVCQSEERICKWFVQSGVQSWLRESTLLGADAAHDTHADIFTKSRHPESGLPITCPHCTEGTKQHEQT